MPKKRSIHFTDNSLRILKDVVRREKIKNVNRAVNTLIERYEKISLTRYVLIKKIKRAVAEFDISIYDFFPDFKPKTRKAISTSLRHQVLKRDGYRCIECGATNKDTKLEIDHIIPVNSGGENTLDNLQVLCKACNGAKSIQLWLGDKSI
jgi:hypothetical protein